MYILARHSKRLSNYSNMTNLSLPKQIKLKHALGEGRRSQVFLAEYLERQVVVKVYKQFYIDKYQEQYKVNIGEFEYSRNKLAYQSDDLKNYVAQPFCLIKPDQGYVLALVQEYIDGIWLEDLMQKNRGLPANVLQAGYDIVKYAAQVGLYDLDIPPGNIRLVKDHSRAWVPKLYDFNLMPQHLCPPNPFMALGFKLGLRSKNHRDYRSLKHWQYLADQASKQ